MNSVGKIDKAQHRQKRQQGSKMKRGAVCLLENGEKVLRRNMKQKTKQGHEMEDKWIGSYTISNLDQGKGTCKLVNSQGVKFKGKVNLQQLKKYVAPDISASQGKATSPTSVSEPLNQTSAEVPYMQSLLPANLPGL